jgi:hypothetical protein
MRSIPFENSPFYERVRQGRPLCAACGQHHAGFLYRGQFRCELDHNLCMRCYRSAIASLRANLTWL